MSPPWFGNPFRAAKLARQVRRAKRGLYSHRGSWYVHIRSWRISAKTKMKEPDREP